MNGPRRTVLVTDGEERAALATVRSLGRAGYRVIVTSASGRSVAGASRFAAAEFPIPSPLLTPDRAFEAVSEIVTESKVDLLLPITEASLLSTLPRREELDGVTIPFPAAATFRAVSDKALVTARAKEIGISVPTLARVEDRAGLLALRLPETTRGSLVLKPVRSVVDHLGERRKTSVAYLPSVGELVPVSERLPPEAFPLLVQRRIIGPGIGIFLLLREGRVLARFAHRRIREKPPSGGVSVLRESVAAPEALFESSAALLQSFDWSGVAMVEFKLDQATGEYHLMEINGRLWGSLQLAMDAGVDFPRLLVEAALEERPEPVLTYRVGVQTRWALGDLDHLLARLRYSPKVLGLPPGAPGRIRAIGDFLASSLPPVHGEVFRWNDPRPGGREWKLWLASALDW